VTVWVGKSVVFKGELVSSEDMTLDGRVEGTVIVRDHVLTIGPDANIHADINARTIVVHGSVTGSIKATEKVDVRHTAKIDGGIAAPRIAVAEGADLHGRIDVQSEQRRHLTVVA
jgi:cytoskeletal protein CcmA (bactofilin family)